MQSSDDRAASHFAVLESRCAATTEHNAADEKMMVEQGEREQERPCGKVRTKLSREAVCGDTESKSNTSDSALESSARFSQTNTTLEKIFT